MCEEGQSGSGECFDAKAAGYTVRQSILPAGLRRDGMGLESRRGMEIGFRLACRTPGMALSPPDTDAGTSS